MALTQISNGDSGAAAREKINNGLAAVDAAATAVGSKQASSAVLTFLAQAETNNAAGVKALLAPTVADVAGLQVIINAKGNLTGTRLLHLSDSFGQQQVGSDGAGPYKSCVGIAVALEVYSRGQFTIATPMIKGVNGNTTAQMLARFGTDVAANVASFDILLLDGGRNDPTASKANGDTTIANLKAMALAGRILMKDVWVILPNPPRSFTPNTATDQKVRAYVNQTMQDWCAANQFPFIDYWRDTVDASASTGAWASGISADALHMNTYQGPRLAALRALRQVGSMYPASYRSRAVWDAYDSSLNPYGNAIANMHANAPRMGGTGGSKTGGPTGSVADGWNLACYGGTGTEAVASKIAGVAGFDSIGADKQRITFGSPSGGWNGEFFGGFTIPASLTGKQASLEFEIEAITWTGAPPGFGAYMRPGTGGTAGQIINVNTPAGDRVLMRSIPGLIGNTGAFCQPALGIFVPSGASGSFDIFNPVLRILS